MQKGNENINVLRKWMRYKKQGKNLRIKEEKNEELRRQRKVIIMTNTDE